MAELLRMPEVAAGMESALLSTWSIAAGAAFTAGSVIAVIETDKAVVDVEAESDGVMLRALVGDGDDVPVGAPIALIAAAGETINDIDATLRTLGVVETPAAPARAASHGDTQSAYLVTDASPTTPVPVTRVFASPLARRMARDQGLAVSQLYGTGPGGRIVRRDVEAAIRNLPTQPVTPAPAPAPTAEASTPSATAEFTDVPHTRLRRAIAARLAESKQTAPHFYLRGSANVDRLLALREDINAGAQTRVSINDFVIKAVAKAHTLVPALNVTWIPDAIRHYADVDIAVAIATDNGLVTPVLRSVNTMTISSIAAGVKDFADRARINRLQQHELEGGSISVTNLGMFGTEEFAAIINPPQSSILAVGAARPEPVVIDGEVGIAHVMRVTLSVDHRPVDGVDGARWMSAFVELLEHPARILA